jgi:selenide,water dikinase
MDLLYDPQTSGGLFISLPADQAEKLVEALHQENIGAWRVGRVVEEHPGKMKIL